MKVEDVKAAGNVKAKDEEIIANFKAQLETGRTFVHAISEPKTNAAGQTFFQLYLIQQQKTINTNVSDLDVAALLWDKERVTNVRSIRNVNAEALANPEVASWVALGTFITLGGKNVNIQREHTLVKPYATAEPIKSFNADGTANIMVFVDENGVETDKPVYSTTKPVLGEPKNVFLKMAPIKESEFKGIEALLEESAGSLEIA